MNPFFERYLRLLAEEVNALGHPAPEVELGGDLSRALLDLTRVVAHTQERRFGPLVAYLTGEALGRLAADGAPFDDAEAAALVDRVTARLEHGVAE